MSRFLGVDLGSRRIGIARSDASGTLASPLRVLERTGDRDRDHDAILAIAREEGATCVVVGTPRSLTGGTGPAEEATRAEVAALRARASDEVRVEEHDERYTTVIAQRRVRESGRRGRRTPVDDVAAAEILQSFLDRAAAAPRTR